MQRSVYGKSRKEGPEKLTQITVELDEGTCMEPSKRPFKNPVRVSIRVKGHGKTPEPLRFRGFVWRRRRDSNPRDPLGAYMISNHAPSTN